MAKLFFIVFGGMFVLAGCTLGAAQVTPDNLTPVNTNQPDINSTTNNQSTFMATQAVIKTSMGDITVEFFGDDSPKTVENLVKLAQDGFYNGTTFHRVIPGFMIQGGDPESKNPDRSRHGTGGPGYTFEDEINQHKLVQGSLAMANRGPNTNGSQFFIVTSEATPWLDGKHTNFGRVVDGLDVVLAIEKVQTDERDNPLTPVVVASIEIFQQ